MLKSGDSESAITASIETLGNLIYHDSQTCSKLINLPYPNLLALL